MNILSRTELNNKIETKNEMVPVLYNLIQAEVSYNGFLALPCVFSKDSSFFLLIAIGTRYLETPVQGAEALASCLLHGENSSDELSKAVIQFMKNKKAQSIIQCWPKLLTFYCLQKVNKMFF